MKKIIPYMLVCCLSCVLVFSSAASAYSATVNVYQSTIITDIMPISNVNIGSSTYNTDYYYGEGLINPSVTVNPYYGDYFSGTITIDIDVSTKVFASNLTIKDFNVEYNGSNSNSLYCIVVKVNDNLIKMFCFFDNFYLNNNDIIDFGNLKFKFSCYTSNQSTDGNFLGKVYSYLSISRNSLQGSSTPFIGGYSNVISNAINNSSDIDSILSLLTDIKTYAINIYNEIDIDIESLLNRILTQDTTTAQKTTLLETYMKLFPQYSRDVVSYLQEISDYLESADAAASEANAGAEQVASQAAVVGNVQKPNVDNLISEVDTRMTPAVYNGMTYLLAFINRPYFVAILMIVFSLAFCGYVFYGKGV